MKKGFFLNLTSLFLLLLLTASLVCCSAENAQGPSESTENPDMIFYKAVYTIGRAEFPPLVIKAESMSVYEKDKKALFTQPEFEQKDENGEVLTKGTCEEAQLDTKTYEALLKGKVIIQRPKDKLLITGENIRWDNDNQRISTDGPVVLCYDENNEIKGEGLTCDFKKSQYEFDKITEGRLIQ